MALKCSIEPTGEVLWGKMRYVLRVCGRPYVVTLDLGWLRGIAKELEAI